MSLDTWVSLGSLLAVGAALYAAMRGWRTELKVDIAGLRAELRETNERIDGTNDRIDRTNDRVDAAAKGSGERIDTLRTEIKTDLGTTNERIDTLRTEIRADLSELRADIRRLDDRTYVLATGLRSLLPTASAAAAE